jgi:hypothetical protein
MIAFLKKNLVLVIILVALILGAAWYLQSRDAAEAPGEVTRTVNDQTVGAIGADILTALNQLNTLKLDRSLFQSRLFLKLRDFSRPIEPQVVGRPNPFAPIGDRSRTTTGSGSATSTASSTPASNN